MSVRARLMLLPNASGTPFEPVTPGPSAGSPLWIWADGTGHVWADGSDAVWPDGGPNITPEIIGVPTISGDTGLGDTLTATPAPVAAYPAPTTVLQWTRDGSDIPGALGTTYTIVEDDQPSDIRVRQTSTNSEGSDTATSEATAIPSGASYLLDTYTGAAAAYSLRRLSSAYTGPAIRVRRSSDNAEQDIGFDGDDLDTAALLTFVGAGDGLVTTGYDQSGNGRNATQSTALKQPKIVESGSLVTLNSKPAISFTPRNFIEASTTVTSSSVTLVSVYSQSNGAGAACRVFGVRNPVSAAKMTAAQGCDGTLRFDGAASSVSAWPVADTQYVRFSTKDGTNITDHSNGVERLNESVAGLADTSGYVNVGCPQAGTGSEYALDGVVQESILYLSDEITQRDGIVEEINAYYGIY